MQNHGISQVTRLAICVAVFVALRVSDVSANAAQIDFNRDIRPILSDKCFACHGPDAKSVKADLRLDIRESAIRNNDGARAIVPGNPAVSGLIKRINASDQDDLMPPSETNKKLTAAEKAAFQQWIEEGAVYQGHWAFIPPTRSQLPVLKNRDGIRNPIDNFIRQRLEKKGLHASAEAPGETLIRRVTFDLTGLPPTLGEVDTFLADKSPRAYENLVTRLLISKRYGEHMARYWLDAVRYGDTHGLHLDNERSMWPYRDWVIRAFNDNLPFNIFTEWQLAGDLLPNPNYDQLTASGYNRCNITTSEGGAIKAEFLARYAVDRTVTTATIFMGLSAGCAVCHDHKFDPLSQKEFYQLYAFFNNASDPAMDGNSKFTPPILKLTTAAQKKQIADWDHEIKELEKLVADELKKINYAEPKNKTKKVAVASGKAISDWPPRLDKPTEYVWIDDELPPDANIDVASGNHPFQWSEKMSFSGKRSMVREGEGVTQHFFTNARDHLMTATDDKLFAWVYLDPDNPPTAVMLQFHSSTWLHRAVWGDIDAINFGTKDTTERVSAGELPESGKWIRLEIETAKIGITPGTQITGMAFTQSGGKVFWDKAGIVSGYKQPYFPPPDVLPTNLVLKDKAEEFVWIEDELPLNANVRVNSGNHPMTWVEKPVFSGKRSMLREGTNVIQHFFDSSDKPLTVGAGDKFFAYVYLDPDNPPTAVMLQYHSKGWSHRANWGDAGAIPYGANGTTQKVLAGDLPEPGKWIRLEVEAEKMGIRPGTRITGMAFTQHGGKTYWDKAGMVTRVNQETPVRAGSASNALSERALTSQSDWEKYVKDDLKFKGVPANIKKLIEKTPEPKRNKNQKKEVTDYYLSRFFGPTRKIFEPLVKKLDPLKKKRADLDTAIPATFVFAESKPMRESFVLMRGEYDKPSDKVSRNTPAFLPPLTVRNEKLPDRLDFARWLTSPKHPLTARVAANRLWQQFFGTGIVRTTEDFGSQGEWPSHPELLDWLAVEFRENGWNVKEFVKLLVTSATYRQSSRVTPGLLQADPQNRLYARGPRFRVDAEIIRDNALFASGLLVEKIGGHGVNPYQPPGIWEAVGYTRSDTANYQRGDGDDLYRRSIYTFWKRTAPPVSLAIFDAPSREACTVRRERTNTPLQALMLMNGVQFVEASRKFAERIQLNGGPAVTDRIRYGFRLITSRYPTLQETEIIRQALNRHRATFLNDTEAAHKLVTTGDSKFDDSLFESDLAAWTMVANLMLNLDEAVTKN